MLQLWARSATCRQHWRRALNDPNSSTKVSNIVRSRKSWQRPATNRGPIGSRRNDRRNPMRRNQLNYKISKTRSSRRRKFRAARAPSSAPSNALSPSSQSLPASRSASALSHRKSNKLACRRRVRASSSTRHVQSLRKLKGSHSTQNAFQSTSHVRINAEAL